LIKLRFVLANKKLSLQGKFRAGIVVEIPQPERNEVRGIEADSPTLSLSKGARQIKKI